MPQSIKYLLAGLLVAGAVALGAPAGAQEADDAPTAEELIDRMVASHQGLKSYQLSGQLTVEVTVAGERDQQSLPVSLACKPGPRFALTMPVYRVYCDGETVSVYIPMARQYKQTEYSPEMWQDSSLSRVLGDALPEEGEAAPGAATMGAAYRALVENREVTGAETVGEYECWVLQGSASVPAPSVSGEATRVSVPVKVWHRKADALIVKAYGDFTPITEAVARQAEEGSAPQGFRMPHSMSYTLVATELKLDEPLSDEAFRFEPPPGATEMGAAGSAGREGLQQFELSGKPAPDFELESLAGETIKLSGLAGKVVVLDFWASWCGPCVAELPHIQELWEKLEGKEVLFIGVNLDRSVEDAERMARQKGLTFPSVRDEGGSVANAYGVRGIPCLVIIDADGKVVGRKLGYDPAVTEMLETEILKLLASAEPEQGAPAGQRSP